LECDGLWLGETRASEVLMLEFQSTTFATTQLDKDLISGWMHSLETFMGNNMSEIGTIFDRLPLQKVIFFHKAADTNISVAIRERGRCSH
jgi:hypothetical protein